MKHTRQEQQQQVEQVRSQLGSLNGSVRMHASENYVQQVADVVAAQDIGIDAKRIDILTDHNRGSRYSAGRNTDSEYKILSNLSDQLGNNRYARGTVTIFTERSACASCLNVAKQFQQRYPNIDVKIFDNSSQLIIPKR
ncbi:deaminase domain-containing protein [Eikenella corrodens]|uniref:Uncharacterized protein n=1 Tax=Eikenella corrodens TaxID=539 RepID=A0A3S9SM89_EIKCO|nr:deaminase domain-containing protein [Eikenella corrodens]AZR60620.1 hypothetical protein ELB75_11780 [Eikenella corrodens]